MFRTTILLPQDLKHKAEEKAHQMGISLGQLVRRSLRESILGETGKRAGKDPFLSDKTVYSGRVPRNLAKSHDRHLYGEHNA